MDKLWIGGFSMASLCAGRTSNRPASLFTGYPFCIANGVSPARRFRWGKYDCVEIPHDGFDRDSYRFLGQHCAEAAVGTQGYPCASELGEVLSMITVESRCNQAAGLGYLRNREAIREDC